MVKIISVIGVLSCILISIVYFNLLHIDFIGDKDPKTVEENVKRWTNTILCAEYINGTDYCKVNLLDAINIEINVGDKYGGVILNEQYKIIKDTIEVITGVKYASKYLSSNQFIIQNTKLLFKANNKYALDTLQAMTIKFNKIKQ
jgi:hypothetical protein